MTLLAARDFGALKTMVQTMVCSSDPERAGVRKSRLGPCGRCQDCIRVHHGDHPDMCFQGHLPLAQAIRRVSAPPVRGELRMLVLDRPRDLTLVDQHHLSQFLSHAPAHVVVVACDMIPETLPPVCRFNGLTPRSRS